MLLNPKLFLTDVPDLNPLSYAYREYWGEERKKCIEGVWAGGRYMPGNLYFYINFWNILLNNKKDPPSAPKKMGLPFLRDFEWEVSYGLMEARGFIGFEKEHPDIEYEVNEKGLLLPKKGVQHLLHNVDRDLGKPLYLNEAKNFAFMGSRGSGKSYLVSGMVIGHEFLFDGLKEYTEETKKNPPTVEILIGAGDAKYSTDTLNKFLFGIDNLPGGVSAFNKYYPPPFYKRTTGSLQTGAKNVYRHEYKKKDGNQWINKGTKSKIYHRTFKDNPYAANGTRTTYEIYEECGLFSNLAASYRASIDTQMNGSVKFGTMIFLGTGGDMEKGTQDASNIFTDPSAYECVEYEDIYEKRFKKIGYFIPYWKALNQYKDENGETIKEKAQKYTNGIREKKKEKSTIIHDSHIQNNPDTVSEMFLSKKGNIFPTKELQDHLIFIEKTRELRDKGTQGEFVVDTEGKLEWRPNPKLKPIQSYPVKEDDDITGCVVMYEPPYRDFEGNTPFGLYIAGTDPVDQDEAADSPSLMSTFIYKTFQDFDNTYNIIVAEYTGRPERADMAYETTRRLLAYYNAQDLYENMLTGFKAYMQQKNCLHLLKQQPGILKKIVPNTKVTREYGIHMTKEIKQQMVIYIRDWLIEERGLHEDGSSVLNLHKIYSVPLLQELIMYDGERNTDRVIALGLCIIAKEDNYLVKVKEETVTVKNSDFFKKKHFKKRR